MEQPVFYYDLGSPYSYLTAERLQGVLPVTPVWQPILLGGIWQQSGGGSVPPGADAVVMVEEVTEANGRDSLSLACQADALAHRAGGRP